MTEIVYGRRPPNFDAILTVFPMAAKPGVVFSYGHQIFVPSGKPLPPELIDHEEVHCARQLALGLDLWWEKYLSDVNFRYWEELLAHRAEYQAMLDRAPSRPARRMALKVVAQKLSSRLYGGMVSLDQAKKAISA